MRGYEEIRIQLFFTYICTYYRKFPKLGIQENTAHTFLCFKSFVLLFDQMCNIECMNSAKSALNPREY